MELIRRQDRYDLYDDNGHKVASTSLNTLSKQNCNEIFGVVDVEKLAREEACDCEAPECEVRDDYKKGFNKAMELNKDKVFTLEDMEKAIDVCIELMNNKGSEFRTHKQTIIQSLQQPTEIEVEIEVAPKENKDLVPLWTYENKLDSNGNLILRKI
jgi:hypothetical protein